MLITADPKCHLALDRAAVQESLRIKDRDGHLHVAATPITKANVCPYLGREIVDWQSHGLQPEKVYRLYRHPEELEKAAKSFNGKPLLLGHRVVSAHDHDHVGTVGSNTNTIWQPPYLMGALDVWSGPAIEKIEQGEAAELSAAYYYRADMTPGTTPEGERYDGVMRDIGGNHVALVPRGRAGRDVVVADAALWAFSKEPNMNKAALSPAAAQTRGALAVYLRSKLATDAAIDFDPFLKDVRADGFKASIPGIVLGLQHATRGKLAQDASLDDAADVVEALAAFLPPDVAQDSGPKEEPKSEPEKKPDSAASDPDKGKDTPAMDGFIKATDFETFKREQAQRERDAKLAQDAALVAQERALTAKFSAIEDARRSVRPWVGDLPMSFDSAEAVVRHTLGMLGKNVAGKHADALMDILDACPKPGERPARPTAVAQDASMLADAEKAFPHMNRLSA